jgi:hypothetical protein
LADAGWLRIDSARRRAKFWAEPNVLHSDFIRLPCRISWVTVVSDARRRGKGEEAALTLFQAGEFDAIATDDVRFIRRLRWLGVPFAVPAVIVVKLHLAGVLSRTEADTALGALVPLISPDERAVAELMLRGPEV